MKRGRGDALTGGTGDVSPQLITQRVIMSAANTYTEATIPIPVARFQLRRGKSMVMELLKVYWDLGPSDSNPSAGGNVSTILAQLSTVSLTNVAPNDPRVISYCNREYRGAFTAAGTYLTVTTDPYVDDKTDGAGHGVIIATDNIFIGIVTGNFVAASQVDFRILYRFKEVSLEEYIGIVQSQQ